MSSDAMTPPRSADAVDREVGRRIAARRLALGLSQTALAERAGVSFQQVQKYESGMNRVSASRLHRIALAPGGAGRRLLPGPRPFRRRLGRSIRPDRPGARTNGF